LGLVISKRLIVGVPPFLLGGHALDCHVIVQNDDVSQIQLPLSIQSAREKGKQKLKIF
jgi:hypothetical protein